MHCPMTSRLKRKFIARYTLSLIHHLLFILVVTASKWTRIFPKLQSARLSSSLLNSASHRMCLSRRRKHSKSSVHHYDKCNLIIPHSVETCLKMCGLENYADAIVGTLSVEHKKRTTIGVELAAKPKLLLFLDEPTSGLDSQSAWAIVSFLRQLANHGQAILCTYVSSIHSTLML